MPLDITESLQDSIRTYEARRREWLRAGLEGKWVVVCGADVVGMFETLGEAYDAGAARYTPGDFLVRKVREKDPVIEMWPHVVLP